MNDLQWDKKLKINTVGREASHEDEYHYPYEPTPYSVLLRLVESDYISCDSIVVDYGCGKGRAGFFLNHKLGCRTVGIEYNEKIYEIALRNLDTYAGKYGVDFICLCAENYEVEDADCFYFFNPFSVEVLRSVLGKIMNSYYTNPRKMQFFFYYPNEEYVSYLMTEPNLMFVDEIDCRDLFDGGNDREQIMIFEVI